jgi:hypothetical protein
MIAARTTQMQQGWLIAEPETRAGLLLSLAWRARSAAPLPTATTPEQYASDLQSYASKHTGDIDTFHGSDFPAMPLPGPAGALASSYAFDHGDLDLSVETALILLGVDAVPVSGA